MTNLISVQYTLIYLYIFGMKFPLQGGPSLYALLYYLHHVFDAVLSPYHNCAVSMQYAKLCWVG